MVCWIIYSDDETCQGLSEEVCDFFNANGNKIFINLLGKPLNHFLVIPFDILKGNLYGR